MQTAGVDHPVCRQRHLVGTHQEIVGMVNALHGVLKGDEAAIGFENALQADHVGMGINNSRRRRQSGANAHHLGFQGVQFRLSNPA